MRSSGRPRVDDAQKRAQKIVVYIDEATKEALTALARAQGLSALNFARQLIEREIAASAQ